MVRNGVKPIHIGIIMTRTYRIESVLINEDTNLHSNERVVSVYRQDQPFAPLKAVIETETPFRSRIATHPSRARFVRMTAPKEVEPEIMRRRT